jgi:hypothetical protein
VPILEESIVYTIIDGSLAVKVIRLESQIAPFERARVLIVKQFVSLVDNGILYDKEDYET